MCGMSMISTIHVSVHEGLQLISDYLPDSIKYFKSISHHHSVVHLRTSLSRLPHTADMGWFSSPPVAAEPAAGM